MIKLASAILLCLALVACNQNGKSGSSGESPATTPEPLPPKPAEPKFDQRFARLSEADLANLRNMLLSEDFTENILGIREGLESKFSIVTDADSEWSVIQIVNHFLDSEGVLLPRNQINYKLLRSILNGKA